MSDVVLFEVSDGVALITFNRPERLNAWTGEMQLRYFDLLAECGERTDVRAIVVTGAGRGFCAGADMQNLQSLSGGDDSARSGPGSDRPVTFPLSIHKPIIAAVNGACAGLGLVIALMCDLRFASTEAKFTTAFVRRGLIAEYGISWILPRLIGQAHALDLLFSGRVLLGEEAASIGLVNRAVPAGELLEETMRYARELASDASPASMAVIKQQVYGDWGATLEQSVQRATELMVESFGRPDFAEGVSSFVERRPPRFAGVGSSEPALADAAS